jgi:myo-inositol 2-dehydrogenase / D-chiro-inositol 1-dehydrogenase
MEERLARLGFVGCGTHATNNLYSVLPYARCRLEAVCDLKAELAERNARLYGARAWFTDAARMLAECELDGVMVVGPPQMHWAVGKQVLAKGLPLFVEKPPAPSLRQAEELVTLAQERGTFVMTGFMKRFGLAYARVKELIESGAFEPAAGLLKYGHWAGTDIDGMLHGMSIHLIDLALWLFGDPVGVYSAMHRSDRTLSLAVTLRFGTGQVVQLMLDGSQPRVQERVEISGCMDGANALLVVDNVQHLELHRQRSAGIDVLAPSMADIRPEFELSDIQVWRPDYGIPNMAQQRTFNQGFAGEVREFCDAILEKREPTPGNADALRAMRLVDALLKRPDGWTDL